MSGKLPIWPSFERTLIAFRWNKQRILNFFSKFLLFGVLTVIQITVLEFNFNFPEINFNFQAYDVVRPTRRCSQNDIVSV